MRFNPHVHQINSTPFPHIYPSSGNYRPGGYGQGDYAPGGFGSGDFGSGGFAPDDYGPIDAPGPSDSSFPFAGSPADPAAMSADPGGRMLARYLALGGLLLAAASVVLLVLGLENLLFSFLAFIAALLAFMIAVWGDTVDRRRRSAMELPGRLMAAVIVRMAGVGIAIVAAWRVAAIVAV